MPTDFSKLKTSVKSSILQMQKPRNVRVGAIRQYVGAHHAEGGSHKRVPTNFLELAVTIYTRQLAARAPRAMVSTSVESLLPYARNMELAINQIPDEIHLGRTLRRAVIEAIFSIGIVKTGICTTGHTVLGHDYGEPFVDVITLDDYFCDMSAKTMETIQYEGNDYWLPLKVARDLAGDSSIQFDPTTTIGENGEERAESVSTDDSVTEYGERVWCRDIWVPDTGELITYGVTSQNKFNEIDWDGPKEGPFRKLTYSDVPGNLMPLSPAALMIDLHELGNALFRKLGKQADAKKTIAAFPGGDDESVKRLREAKDGDGINFTGGKPESITVGGIDQPTLGMFLQVRDLFSYFAGNLDSLGGLAPATDTVGQDQMLTAAANGRMDYMKDQTVDFAKGIFGDLAWYAWTDPVRERAIEKQVDGTDIVLRSEWSAETRDGDFLDYNLDIDAYSMQNDTPSIRLQKIGQVFQNYIVPLMPQIEAQGGQIDFQKLLELVGRYSNLSELAEFIKFQGPPTDQQNPHGNPRPVLQSPNTTRTNVRISRTGATRHGKDDVMSRILMGAGVQQSEAESLGKGIG